MLLRPTGQWADAKNVPAKTTGDGVSTGREVAWGRRYPIPDLFRALFELMIRTVL